VRQRQPCLRALDQRRRGRHCRARAVREIHGAQRVGGTNPRAPAPAVARSAPDTRPFAASFRRPTRASSAGNRPMRACPSRSGRHWRLPPCPECTPAAPRPLRSPRFPRRVRQRIGPPRPTRCWCR
jgi:hypothetical protein